MIPGAARGVLARPLRFSPPIERTRNQVPNPVAADTLEEIMATLATSPRTTLAPARPLVARRPVKAAAKAPAAAARPGFLVTLLRALAAAAA
jgi:hypothetical protein